MTTNASTAISRRTSGARLHSAATIVPYSFIRIPNRDDPTSTHVFLDMGGGSRLAFFDFPERDTDKTIRGVGSMHHVALRAPRQSFARIVSALEARGIDYSLHGSREAGSLYVRDPDGVLLEITA